MSRDVNGPRGPVQGLQRVFFVSEVTSFVRGQGAADVHGHGVGLGHRGPGVSSRPVGGSPGRTLLDSQVFGGSWSGQGTQGT